MFGKKWCARVLVAVGLALTITSVVYAVRTTINTDNGSVDANWGSVTLFSNDGDDFADNNYDINQAWLTNAPDNSEFYFRVNLVGSGRLPQDYSSFEARLDCNRDGDFADAVDVVVYYATRTTSDFTEEVVECQGNDYYFCDYAPTNTSDTNADTFGEEIAGSPYTYEWKADVVNGATNWSQCLGDINVQFASLNTSQVLQESTVWRGYNVTPNAVALKNFTAQPSRPLDIWPLVAISVFAVVAGAWAIGRVIRRRMAH
ncbi:hypothetical protein BAC2_02021 [uncultured bacterium]|nr:hypothetical protein BAC2_02021 [uncultured bacterium]